MHKIDKLTGTAVFVKNEFDGIPHPIDYREYRLSAPLYGSMTMWIRAYGGDGLYRGRVAKVVKDDRQCTYFMNFTGCAGDFDLLDSDEAVLNRYDYKLVSANIGLMVVKSTCKNHRVW